ncbi:hypothetical protein MTR67_023172 [Solanum verrucosum]|uniref:Uncharacterized protein n=1 Tax=Solanum verrucosum TaxID=315347 RepID=A0AAF0QT08_SOLVR|nr:hypothetical protein MTR67_023172 [Solanum verrucosum]
MLSCNANTVPPVLNHEVLHAEYRNVFQVFAQSVANQKIQQSLVLANTNGGSAAARVRDFVRINPSEFLGSKCKENRGENAASLELF